MRPTFVGAFAAAFACGLAAGCAAAPPPIASLIASGHRRAACDRVAGVSGERDSASALHEAREGAALLAQQYRISVTLSVETLESANEALGRPLLRGEIAPLVISAVSEGPELYGVMIAVAAREDGARWESIVEQRTLHDTLRSLFGARGERLPPDDQRTTRHAVGPQFEWDAWRSAVGRLESRHQGCRRLSTEPCTQWVPLARAAPSLGSAELLIKVAYWLKDATDTCMFERTYAVALPPGDSLVERLSALSARGPLVLGPPSGPADAAPRIK
jgi:hypothetical protein